MIVILFYVGDLVEVMEKMVMQDGKEKKKGERLWVNEKNVEFINKNKEKFFLRGHCS